MRFGRKRSCSEVNDHSILPCHYWYLKKPHPIHAFTYEGYISAESRLWPLLLTFELLLPLYESELGLLEATSVQSVLILYCLDKIELSIHETSPPPSQTVRVIVSFIYSARLGHSVDLRLPTVVAVFPIIESLGICSPLPALFCWRSRTIHHERGKSQKTTSNSKFTPLSTATLHHRPPITQHHLPPLHPHHKPDLLPPIIPRCIPHPPRFRDQPIPRPHRRRKPCLELAHAGRVAVAQGLQQRMAGRVPGEQAVHYGAAEAHLLPRFGRGVERVVIAVQPNWISAGGRYSQKEKKGRGRAAAAYR